MLVFESNYRNSREVLIFCFHLKKTAAEAHWMLLIAILTVRLFLVQERVMSGLMSRTGMAVEKRKFSKIPNCRHNLLKSRAKHKKNWQNHWEWLNKPLRNPWNPWEWFRRKKIGFRTSGSWEIWNCVSLLVNSCFKDRIERGFYIGLIPATKNGSTMIIPSTKIMGNAQACLHVDGQTEYSQCQGYTLNLVGPARCGVLWAVEAEWNHHRRSVYNAIDAFELIIEGETATVPRETRQSYPSAWQCSATSRKTNQDILENAEMGGLTRGSPQKTHRFFEMVSDNCQKDGKV